ncbi:MAG: stage V sporulation protein AD [Clostridiales bacterium]|nr:stage V sporulation protein AD [Clostridiales bacterium]
MNSNRQGKQSVVFPSKPKILASAAIVGDLEGNGPIGKHFDFILEDDTWGEDSWEKAERKMYEQSVRLACNKCNIAPENLDCMVGGDILNQLISANFGARALKAPYLGMYSACATMIESMLVGTIMIDGEYASTVSVTACSHFSTAERQYRSPLELGGQRPPTAQRTVTGSGCAILVSNEYKPSVTNTDELYQSIEITGGTIGKVIDLGVKDANNLGAAMAPAAADTIEAHLNDFNRTVDDYDLIVTGDLGSLGSALLIDLCKDKNIDLKDKHIDCGNTVFCEAQKFDCGGSGGGCCAVTLCGYLLKRLEAGDINKMLFIATGVLLSPDTTLQGDTIPSIAHAVVLERSNS